MKGRERGEGEGRGRGRGRKRKTQVIESVGRQVEIWTMIGRAGCRRGEWCGWRVSWGG